MSNSSNLMQVKSSLMKYCYISGNTKQSKLMQELLRDLMLHTENLRLLILMNYFFLDYVMPFYFPCRYQFNIVRSYFMKYLLSMLIKDDISQEDVLCMFGKYRSEWTDIVGANAQTYRDILDSLMNKLNDETNKIMALGFTGNN